MSTTAGPDIVESSLVLHLDAANSKSYSGSGATWTNLANTSLNTTLVNAPTYASNAFSFNGTTQSAGTGIIGTTFTTDSEFSIGCWAKFTAYKTDATSIGTLVGAFAYQGYGLQWRGTPTSCTIGNYMRYASTVSESTNYTVTPGTWFYAVQTYKPAANEHKLYINGSLFSTTTTISGAYNTNMDGKYIGIGYGSGSNTDGTPGGGTPGTPFYGSISNVTVYNQALSATQVLQNFNALRGRYGI